MCSYQKHRNNEINNILNEYPQDEAIEKQPPFFRQNMSVNSTMFLLGAAPRSDLNHPFHLHGYAFYVMDMGQYAVGQTAQDLLTDLKTRVRTSSTAPILKDTIAVPSGGYAVIKFKANNPGKLLLSRT
jgi:cytochrome c biogenesis protein ResB